MARRESKREAQREIKNIVGKAKSAMYEWIMNLGYEPEILEVQAWQAGYIAGLRQKEND